MTTSVSTDSKKHVIKRSISGIVRACIVGIALLIQVGFVVALVLIMELHASWMYLIIEIMSLILVFALVNDKEDYKHFWIVIVLLFPVFGGLLYFLWGRRRTNSRQNKRFREVDRQMTIALKQNDDILSDFQSIHPNKVQISRFLRNEGFPLYNNTDVTYYEIGEKFKEALLCDLRKAKEYIFLQYFIISDGVFWQEMYDILCSKVKEGVRVRLIIDDFGCIILNTRAFRRQIREDGIELAEFAPIHKDIERLSFNYRSHQKITVIDGNVGFTGGINIADEYINELDRFGHWKDSAIRLEGDGVYSLTCFFLETWQICKNMSNEDYRKYMPTVNMESECLVQPFADGPANNPKNTAEAVYSHMINKAREYIYITTPYLVLDQSMTEHLCRAAKSGVDVRLITPHRYDKWYVYMVTVSNYGDLLENGVKIYEYTPGFIHAKNLVSDDEVAICGTINMDYRSFFLHYECAVLMSMTNAVKDIKNDFLETLDKCEEISYEKWKKRPLGNKIMQSLLKLFSPLL